MITWMKKGNKEIVWESFCLTFHQFQPGCVYKSVAFRKKRVLPVINENNTA